MKKNTGGTVCSTLQQDQRRYTLVFESLKDQLQPKQPLWEMCPLK